MPSYDRPTHTRFGNMNDITTPASAPAPQPRALGRMTITDLRVRNKVSGGFFFQNSRSSGGYTREVFSHVRMAVRYAPDGADENGDRIYVPVNGHVFCTSEVYHRDHNTVERSIKLWHMGLDGDVSFIDSLHSQMSDYEHSILSKRNGFKKMNPLTFPGEIMYEVRRGSLREASKMLVKAWAEANPPIKE